jgi:hypothetical protein
MAEVHAVELTHGDVPRAGLGVREPADLHQMVDAAAGVVGSTI